MNVTDGDRERAAALLLDAARNGGTGAALDAIAAALAEERDRARVPFLAALAGLEGEADLINPHTPGTPGYHGANGLKTGIAYAISKLRSAAEEMTE